SGLYRCEAHFGNWGPTNGDPGFLYFDRRMLEFGKALQVKLGDDAIFDGRVMAIEASFPEGQPPQIGALAEDRFQDLRMTRRTRTFSDMSDSDVINQIANDHGLTPDVRVTGPNHKVLAQVNQSDLALMGARARTMDAELWVDGRTLHAQTHTSRNAGTVRLAHGNELREFTVLADLAEQRTSVTVSGWDVASKAGLRYEASDSIVTSELNGDV